MRAETEVGECDFSRSEIEDNVAEFKVAMNDVSAVQFFHDSEKRLL